jgi:hypothetical protein
MRHPPAVHDIAAQRQIDEHHSRLAYLLALAGLIQIKVRASAVQQCPKQGDSVRNPHQALHRVFDVSGP